MSGCKFPLATWGKKGVYILPLFLFFVKTMQSNGIPSGHAIFCLDLDICFQLIFRKKLRLCLKVKEAFLNTHWTNIIYIKYDLNANVMDFFSRLCHSLRNDQFGQVLVFQTLFQRFKT
jgi:hypothetical protein